MEKDKGQNSQSEPVQSQPLDSLQSISERRPLIPLAFGLAFVLFFFSFCNLKCNGTKVASLKGINLVTGTHLKPQVFQTMEENLNVNGQNPDLGQKVPANFWAMIAFLSAIGGVIVFYKKPKSESFAGTILGITGFISLILLQFMIRDKIKVPMGGMAVIDVEFTFAYWLCLLCFIAAGGISMLRLKNERNKNQNTPFTPPEKTPTVQVKIITKNED